MTASSAWCGYEGITEDALRRTRAIILDELGMLVPRRYLVASYDQGGGCPCGLKRECDCGYDSITLEYCKNCGRKTRLRMNRRDSSNKLQMCHCSSCGVDTWEWPLEDMTVDRKSVDASADLHKPVQVDFTHVSHLGRHESRLNDICDRLVKLEKAVWELECKSAQEVSTEEAKKATKIEVALKEGVEKLAKTFKKVTLFERFQNPVAHTPLSDRELSELLGRVIQAINHSELFEAGEAVTLYFRGVENSIKGAMRARGLL